MVLYGITLVYMDEELRAADPGILYPFYADDVVFDGSARCSAQLLKLLMKMRLDRGYFPDTESSLFISYTQGSRRRQGGNFWRRG